MLLVMDVGNTNTTVGLFEGERRVAEWRLATLRHRTVDEWGVLIGGLFAQRERPLEAVTAVVIASVVPPIDPVLEEMCRQTFSLEPLFVEPGVRTGMSVLTDNPHEVGADRIVNGVAAFARWGGPLIIIDFGTATTFDAISARGEYLGGAIAPGLGISAEALFHEAARLPRVAIQRPPRVVGKNTVHSMESGLYYGYVSLVEGIVRRMSEEMGQQVRVVATGGLAGLLADDMPFVEAVDPFLTLEGLRLIYLKSQ